ncbi:MAG: ATP synthase F1 subunit epsilon [Pseudomonadota bacterium]
MADTMTFELVSPEKKLVSMAVEAVTLPGTEGELTAMPQHAPFLTSLRPGVVTAMVGGATHRFVVTGGFVEVTNEEVGLVAEDAAEADAVDRDWLDTRIASAETAVAEAAEERKVREAQRLADLRQLGQELGL